MTKSDITRYGVPQQLAVTKKGREQAEKLSPQLGYTHRIFQICSLICRHATTHHRLMEIQCSVEMSETQEAEVEAKVEWLEQRITELVGLLPETDDGELRPLFQGDPRGVTVKLLVRDFPRHDLYDGWANEGILVPQ